MTPIEFLRFVANHDLSNVDFRTAALSAAEFVGVARALLEQETVQHQAAPVIAFVTESGDFSATVGWTLNPLPVGAPLYESPPQQAEPNKGNG